MLNNEQIAHHYSGIGGSMAASILGVNKYQSNVEAYLLLTDEEYRKEKQRSLSDKLQIEIGNMLESLVAKHIQIEKGWKLVEPTGTLIDPEYPFLKGHPDRLIENNGGLIEIKTRGRFGEREYGEEGTDQIQDGEYIQMQHYFMLTGLKSGWLCALMLGDSQIKYFLIERHEGVIAAIRENCVEFWNNHVIPKIPPKILKYDDAASVWQRSISFERLAGDEIIRLAKEIKEHKRLIKHHAEELDPKQARIAEFLNEADTLVDGDYNKILTWKTQETNRIDLDLLRSKYSDIALELTNKTTSRVMRFNKKWGDNNE